MKHSSTIVKFIRNSLNLLLRESFIPFFTDRNRLVRLLLVTSPCFLRYRGYLPLDHDGEMDSA